MRRGMTAGTELGARHLPAFRPAACLISNRHFAQLETVLNSQKTKARDDF
jgi:hypothetical protein